MACKCKKVECPAGEKWAVPYADFLSLLLALFIALYAISTRDVPKTQALASAFVTIFDSPPKAERTLPVIQLPSAPGSVKKDHQTQESKSTSRNAPTNVITTTQFSNLLQDGGLLEQIEQGTILRLPSDILFSRGSADLMDADRIRALNLLTQVIMKLPKEVMINVRGYTDDSVPAGKYETNYQLAADRAYNVMQFLINAGVDPSRLSYTSYGEYNPLLPNTSEVNRRANNRVDIYFSTTKEDINEVQNTLDELRERR